VPKGYTRVGQITRAVGLKGDVKAAADATQLAVGEVVYIFLGGEPTPLRIVHISSGPAPHRLGFDGISNRTDADKLRGLEIYVKGELESTDPWRDVVGLQAEDFRAGPLGKIEEVLEYPGQFLARVRYAGKELLIPLREELIRERKSGAVVFELPEGLLDLA
jgi:ribosomal 30S subunit maturation factor RimM